MGIRRNRLLSAGLSAVIVVLAMSGTGIQASASPVSGPNFSTPQGIDQYLQSRGVDPGAAIRQTGPKNYVGNHCPGNGWHCLAPTHTPVVQIAPAGGVNEFTCSPATGSGSCFVLQVNAGTAGNPSGGANEFNCIEGSVANPATLDAASCGKLTQSTTNGENRATIVQAIAQRSADGTSQSAMETAGSSSTAAFSQTNTSGTNEITIGQASLQYSSDAPTATQTAYVSQVNGSGKNQATVGQLEQQQVSDAASSQDQEGTQVACVTQDSLSGPNLATVDQVMSQHEQDSAVGATQNQNPTPGSFSSCGSGAGASSTTIQPNLAAFVIQDGNTAMPTGANQQDTKQSLQQQEGSSAPSGTVYQTQGYNVGGFGGLEAIPYQNSTALSAINIGQDEHQTMQASTTGAVQAQWDPIHQPYGFGFQGSNTGDTFQLTQNGTQLAGPGASQNYNLAGDCVSSGPCNVQQSVTTNAGTTNQSCPPNPAYVCSNGLNNEEECDAVSLAAQPDIGCGAPVRAPSMPARKASGSA